MRLAPVSLAVLALTLGACISQAPEHAAPEDAAPSSSASAADKGPAKLERTGVYAPIEAAALSLWPEAYSGELLVLEARPHGTIVEEGEVVARLELRGVQRQVEDAESDLRSATVRHAAQLQKNAMADEAAADALTQAKARLDRAQRKLKGYVERELEFASRSKALQTKREKGFVDDQVDELEQLEAMYEADELVDATEDIVLKRSRRDLERTRESTALSAERRAFEDEHSLPMQIESRSEEVALQESALARLERTQAVDATTRDDAALRSASELGKKAARLEELSRDLTLMELKAPRAGVLLHGKLEDYRPGGKPPRWQRGSRFATRTDLMLVADPGHVAVALDVPEKDLARLENGARAQVSPLANPDATQSGRVDIERYPAARGGSVFDARIELGETPEVMFGMGAKVEIECSAEAQG